MVDERRVVVRRFLGLCALSACLFPAPARAEGVVSAGLQLGMTLEKEPKVEWGISLLASRVTIEIEDWASYENCRDTRTGHGGWLRFSMIGASSPRLALGAHFGRQFGPEDMGYLGELGMVFRTDEPGVGIHTAALGHFAYLNFYARQQWLLDTYTMGVEGRVVPTFGSSGDCRTGGIAVGRPLRSSSGRTIVGMSRASGRALGTPEAVRAARRWEQDSREECASVSAFLELARDLLLAGAPDSLVERALDAAEDEMLHAGLCALVASELSGRTTWPVLPPPSRPPLSDRRAVLERLARESWLDGCLNEGAAARIAEVAAERSSGPLVRQAQARIASDEANHAELGWQVLLWAADVGGPVLRDGLRRACDAPPRPAPSAPDDSALGQLAGEERALLAAQTSEACRQRAAAVL
ncbi:MAG TPA: hypothetical protein VM686_21625 [Polyangiaceae bacterium]|nr:hypothetical protein [Polyangiaceae bacterium]